MAEQNFTTSPDSNAEPNPGSDGRKTIHVVGAGLAGSECAWQLAERGYKVVLVEMRGVQSTPAHKTDQFAELVCSNSFGSQTDYSAPGQLKWEAEKLNSFILKAARECSVPAGMALGVDREKLAQNITVALQNHPNVTIERRVVLSLDEIPRPAVIATGPLTHESLARSMIEHLSYGESHNDFLYFFDAIAPIIDVDTINMDIVWRADRFNQSTAQSSDATSTQSTGATTVQNTDPIPAAAYLNCPLDKEQYFSFIEAIRTARKIEPKEFEKTPYFDGCMPIEVMVERGPLTPRFGPMSPNGLENPQTGTRPFAVVQLRPENRECTSYNMVGFQTKMAYGDQKEVFRKIPGLEQAEFLKLGSMHRNLYIHSPKKLSPVLSSKRDPQLFFAGQITGVEGYFDSTCMGLLVARFLDEQLQGRSPTLPPRETAMGSLLNAITEYKEHFQPTNISFGLFPVPTDMPAKLLRNRDAKRLRQLEIAKTKFAEWLR